MEKVSFSGLCRRQLALGVDRSFKKECDRVGIDFLSTPYDLEAVDMLDPFVLAFKIGSVTSRGQNYCVRLPENKSPCYLPQVLQA